MYLMDTLRLPATPTRRARTPPSFISLLGGLHAASVCAVKCGELVSKLAVDGEDGHRTQSGEGRMGTTSMEWEVFDTLSKPFETS